MLTKQEPMSWSLLQNNGHGRVRQTTSNELLFLGLSLREVTIPWQLLTIIVECKIYRHLIVKDFPTARIILDGF